MTEPTTTTIPVRGGRTAHNPGGQVNDDLARLIDQHAPHGFAGVMRAPDDGCPVYVAAVALFDALGTCSSAAATESGQA